MAAMTTTCLAENSAIGTRTPDPPLPPGTVTFRSTDLLLIETGRGVALGFIPAV